MRYWLALLILAVAVGSYASSFPGEFHYDDYPLLLESSRVNSSSFDYVAFIDHYGGRPLTLWSFHINYLLSGASPAAFHTVSVAVHGAVAVVLFLLLLSWTSNQMVALSSAWLFAIHPAQTQAVNYIWSRSILLMAFFGLSALLLGRRRFWVSLVLLQLAVWSRAEALVLSLPLILVKPGRWKSVSMLVVLNLAGLFYGWQQHQPGDLAWTHPDWIGYWSAAGVAFWKYIGLMFWPFQFSIIHSYSVPSLGASLGAFMALAVSTTAALCLYRRQRLVSAGFLWIMLLLSPSLLIPNSDSFNEGRIYLALAGFALMFGSVLATISSRLPHLRGRLGPLMQKVGGSVELGKGIPVVAVLIVVSALALPTTLWRNQIWNEDVCIWEEAALRNAGDYRTHYNLGVALARKGSLEEARWRFGRSKDLNPDDDMSYAGLGFCAESEELWPEALEFYGTAVKLNPNNNYAVSAVRRVESVIEKEVD